MEDDPDEEKMEYIKLDNERKRQWRMFFEGNDEGVDDNKEFLHDKRWDVYVNEKKKLIKGWYLVRFLVLTGMRFVGKW